LPSDIDISASVPGILNPGPPVPGILDPGPTPSPGFFDPGSTALVSEILDPVPTAPVSGMLDPGPIASNLNPPKKFKNILQEYYAQHFNIFDISYSASMNEEGLFVSTVSITINGDTENVKVYKGLSPFIKASEQNAAEIAFRDVNDDFIVLNRSKKNREQPAVNIALEGIIGNSGDVVSTVFCRTCQAVFGSIDDFQFYSKTETDCEFALNRNLTDSYIRGCSGSSDERGFKFTVGGTKGGGAGSTKQSFMTVHCLSCIRTQNEDNDVTRDRGADGSEKRNIEKKTFQIDEKIAKNVLKGKVGVLSEDVDKNSLCVFGPSKLCFQTSSGAMAVMKSWKLAFVSPLFRELSKVNMFVMTIVMMIFN
jgi:hypothetical protein